MKKIVLFFILSLLIFSQVLYSQKAVELFNKGEGKFQEKNWDDALYYYKKSLKENPYYTRAILRIIEINFEYVKNHQEAEKYIEKLLKVDPKNMEGLNFQGRLALKQDKEDKALKIFSRMKEIEPLNYNALLGLARVYIKMRYFSQAEKYLQKLLKIDEKRLDGYLTYVKLYIIQNKLDEPEKYLKKAMYYHPTHADIYFYYGLLYDKKNYREKAGDYYQKAHARDPDNSDTVLNLADIYFSLREWNNSIKFLKNSLKRFPDMPLLYNKLALSYLFKNEIDNAINDFKKAYNLNTTDDIIQYHLENLLIRKKSFYDEDRKKFAAMHFAIAEKFDSDFYRYDALYEYKRGLQIHSENWHQRYNLALLYKNMGFLEKYLKELKIALMLNPDNQLLKDKLEKARTFMAKRLSIKLNIDQYKVEKDSEYIFIPAFNKTGNNFINNQTGKVIADSINNHLSLHNKFASIDYDHDNVDLYFNMSRNEIKKLAKKNKAMYYVFGQFRENSDYLSVDFKLYPVNGDEAITAFSSVSRGRDKLYRLSKYIAEQINIFFSTVGTIIKIKIDNNLVINLGKDDDVKEGDRIEIYDRGSISKDFDLNRFKKIPSKKIGSAKIIRVDEQISEAKLEKLDYINKVSLYDKIILVKKKETGENKKK